MSLHEFPDQEKMQVCLRPRACMPGSRGYSAACAGRLPAMMQPGSLAQTRPNSSKHMPSVAAPVYLPAAERHAFFTKLVCDTIADSAIRVL